MILIRPYREQDSVAVAAVITEAFTRYDLAAINKHQQAAYLGPFVNANSKDPAHQQQIAILVQAPIFFIAQDESNHVVAVLRAIPARILTLAVYDFYFFQDIGRQLVEHFEQQMLAEGLNYIKVSAPLHLIDFYLRLGYKRSTGIRSTSCFPNGSLPCQPMKKQIDAS